MLLSVVPKLVPARVTVPSLLDVTEAMAGGSCFTRLTPSGRMYRSPFGSVNTRCRGPVPTPKLPLKYIASPVFGSVVFAGSRCPVLTLYGSKQGRVAFCAAHSVALPKPPRMVTDWGTGVT